MRSYSTTRTINQENLFAKSHPRPNYFEVLPKNKHFMADIISEDSPYIFMNQNKFSTGKIDTSKISKYNLNPEMTLNFYTAYKYFLQTLTTYSESLNSETPDSKDIRKELLSIVEPTLMEELDDYMLTNMTQDGCQLQFSNLEEDQLDDESDEENEEMALDQVKVQLMDLSFTLGSHIDRNLNQKQYI